MRVLFFAQLADATACAAYDLSAPAPLTEAELWAVLTEKFPALAAHRASTRLARNGEYATAGMMFSDADEVALIPPVSGG